jgi:hypothetical protein
MHPILNGGVMKIEALELLTTDEAMAFLRLKSRDALMELRRYDPSDPFTWLKGIHWFQRNERSVLYNKRAIAVWLVAKDRDDPSLHQAMIQEFQASLPKFLEAAPDRESNPRSARKSSSR